MDEEKKVTVEVEQGLESVDSAEVEKQVKLREQADLCSAEINGVLEKYNFQLVFSPIEIKLIPREVKK